MICDKCWRDAYSRMISDPSKTQTDHYLDLLDERADNPCTKEEQGGSNGVKVACLSR